jgi:acetyltransferase
VRARAKPRSARHIVANIVAGGFPGPVYVVSPNYAQIEAISAVKSVDAIAGTLDVAVIAVPPAAVPETIAAAGATARGVPLFAGYLRGPGTAAGLHDQPRSGE